MKFQVKGLVGKHEVLRDFPNIETASKEFERIKKKGLEAILLVDGNDISSTVVIAEAETKVEAPVVVTSEKFLEKVVFAWKEADTKKQIIVYANRAQLLLSRAERAGRQACIIGKDHNVIAKVNC